MCMKETFWRRLAEKIEMPQLIDDQRFCTFAARLEHRNELVGILKNVFRRHTTAEWLERLRGEVPCGPVNTVAEALREPQVLAREMVVEYEHPRFGTVRDVGCPIKIDDAAPQFRAAPALGADTESVLRELLGMSIDDIESLRSKGAI
jgi:crotonobetainyl-CoA:carnitine CoA-transferase CaiB-like acyl-CoA transferase